MTAGGWVTAERALPGCVVSPGHRATGTDGSLVWCQCVWVNWRAYRYLVYSLFTHTQFSKGVGRSLYLHDECL